MLQRLIRWLQVPIDLSMWVGLLAGVLMVIHVVIDVTGRTVFNAPLPGTTEVVSAYYMVAIAYLPWAWISTKNNHILAEIFTRIGTDRFVYWVDVIVKIFTIAFVGVFTWQTGLRAVQQTRAGEVWQASSSFIAIWPCRWILPIAGGLMVLYLFLRVLSDIAEAPQR